MLPILLASLAIAIGVSSGVSSGAEPGVEHGAERDGARAIATVTASPPDSLTVPGVSRELAEFRTARIRNVRYELYLDLTRRDTAYGRVTVHFERVRDGDVILDFRGPVLSPAVVNGVEARSAKFDGAHLRIPATALHLGANAVQLDFRSLIAPAGASIIRFHDATDDQDYLYTLLVPSDANALFPCFDQPDLKARLALSLTTPQHWRALGNGAVTRMDTSAAPATTHYFAVTEPLSTYLMAFAAGPWAAITRTVDGRDITVFARASRAAEVETDSLVAANARALTWLESYTDRQYPFGKFAILLAPAFPFGGMEHPGAVFYSEDALIFREPPTRAQLLGREQLIYHEVAHQWFGDLVTMRWFDDLWLKEGFSTYLGAVMQDALNPEANTWRTFFLRNKPVAYATDASRGTTPVWQELANLDQAKSNYGPIVYNKAPGILKALSYAIGDTAFRDGLRAYLRAHAFGSATWQDLIAALSRSSGQDLSVWSEQYILRPGMPVVTQRVIPTRDGWRLELAQAPAQLLSGTGTWPIRTEVLVRHAGGAVQRFPLLLTDSVTTRTFAGLPPTFVFANAGDNAYALVHIDSASARWAGRNVRSVADPLQRAMTWGAMWDRVRSGVDEPSRFIMPALLAAGHEEDEYILPFILGRVSRALSAYVCPTQQEVMTNAAERVLTAGASDTARSYSIRKAQLDTYIDLARSPTALMHLDAALDSMSFMGLPLRPPTRWAIVTTLLARGAARAEQRLTSEMQRDSTSDGRRRAFIAGAARPDSTTKAAYWNRYFGDSTLNENWATASLGGFNDIAHAELTLPYLRPALDSLPWIQQNRRIFYLGSWLGSFMSSHRSDDALQVIDGFLGDNPTLAPDLRLKVLQARDELERTVRMSVHCGALGRRVAAP